MMKILATGASGMLGSSLCPIIQKQGHNVLATDINISDAHTEFLDVREYDQLERMIKKFDPDFIMHLAAETDLEKCELTPDEAYLTNTIGTHNIALLCNKKDICMAYISTAGVFDGSKEGFYDEYDQPNPINIYGKTKFEGEKLVEKFLAKYFIVRAGWMIGGAEKDKKFVMKIIKQLDEGKIEINAVDDKYGTPTYTYDFAKCISNLINTKFFGLYHMVCEGGSGTRYDVAQEILKFLGRKDVKLNRVNSDYFKETYFAPRPKSEMLKNYNLQLRGLNSMRNWKSALCEYLNNYFRDRKNPI